MYSVVYFIHGYSRQIVEQCPEVELPHYIRSVFEFSFIDFWRAKREILDDNYEDERDIWNLGQPRNKTLSRYEATRGDAFDPEYIPSKSWPISSIIGKESAKSKRKNRNEHKKWLQ